MKHLDPRIHFMQPPVCQPDSLVTLLQTASLQEHEPSLEPAPLSIPLKTGVSATHLTGKSLKLRKASISVMPQGDDDPADSLRELPCQIKLPGKTEPKHLFKAEVHGQPRDMQHRAIQPATRQKIAVKFKKFRADQLKFVDASGASGQGLKVKADMPSQLRQHAFIHQEEDRKLRHEKDARHGSEKPAKKKPRHAYAQIKPKVSAMELACSDFYPNLPSPVSHNKTENNRFLSLFHAPSGSRNTALSPDQRKRVRFNELANSGVYIEQTGFTPVKQAPCFDPFEKKSEVLREQRHHWMRDPDKIPYIGVDDHWQPGPQHRERLIDACLNDQYARLRKQLAELNAKRAHSAGQSGQSTQQSRQLLMRKISLVEHEMQAALNFQKSPQAISEGLHDIDDAGLIDKLGQALLNRKKNASPDKR